MKTMFQLVFILGLFTSCSTVGTRVTVASMFPHYSMGASSTLSEYDSDFRRCLDGWKSTRASRTQVLSAIENRNSYRGKILAIEVGNSSYVQYNFVIAADGQLESSYGPEKSYSHELQFLIDQVNVSPKLWEQMKNSEGFDENCYFVTVVEETDVKTFAFYGLDLTSIAGRLVQTAISESVSE